MRSAKLITVVVAVMLSTVCLTSCEEPGPLEKAGKEADKALDDASDKTKELLDKAKKKVKEAEG